MPQRTDRSYRDSLWVVIERMQSVIATDTPELSHRLGDWERADAKALQLATELLAYDGRGIGEAAADERYHDPAVVRHLLTGLEALFGMKDSAHRLVQIATAAVTVAMSSACRPEQRSTAWRLQGDALRLAGNLREAKEALRAAEIEAAYTSNRDYYAALVRYSLAMAHLDSDEPSRAQAYLNGLATTFRANEDRARAANVGELEGWLLYLRQEYAAAADAYRSALAERPDPMREVRITNNVGRCYLLHGDAVSAEQYLSRALSLAVAAGDRETEAHATRGLAELSDDVQGLLDAQALYDQLGYVGESIRVGVKIARCELQQGYDAKAIADRCRSIALRACSCGLSDYVTRELLALEPLARDAKLTSEILTHAHNLVSPSARHQESVWVS